MRIAYLARHGGACHAVSPRTQRPGGRRNAMASRPSGLHSKFQASLGYKAGLYLRKQGERVKEKKK